MKHARAFVPSLALAAALLAGCQGQYEVVVIAGSDEVVRDGAAWELAIVQDGCEGGADSGLPPSPDRLVRSLSWRAGEDGPAVGDLDPGRYGFYVRLRDETCTVRWAGCAELRAEAGGSGRVTIELGAVSGPGCDDDDPCTADGCDDAGACTHEAGDVDADRDGATCQDDCDDANAEVSPSATEQCNGRDDDCDGDADEGGVCGGDDDRCLEQRLGEATFLACMREVSWPAGLDVCARHAAVMSALYVTPEMMALIEQFAGLLPSEWWIGVNDRTVEGRWDGADGQPIEYDQWAPGEPDGGASSDCVLFSVAAEGWQDTTCEELHPVVCEVL